jgi:hypothetical protein
MKTLKTISKIFVLTTCAFMLSCSSDDDGGGGEPAGNYLRMKVDGANFANSDLVEPSAMLAGGTLNILASTDTGDNVQIQIPNYHGVDTYNNGDDNLMNGYINYMDMISLSPPNYVSYTSVRGVGQVIIEESDDTHVKGTFTATVFENVENSTNDKSITEGRFNIEF